jgi:hypothetical protein
VLIATILIIVWWMSLSARTLCLASPTTDLFTFIMELGARITVGGLLLGIIVTYFMGYWYSKREYQKSERECAELRRRLAEATAGAERWRSIRTFKSALSDKKWACSEDGNDDLCEVASYYMTVEWSRLLLSVIMAAAIALSVLFVPYKWDPPDIPDWYHPVRDGLFIFATWLVAIMGLHTEWFRRHRRKKKMDLVLMRTEAKIKAMLKDRSAP